jgi:hypothetical protein
MQPLSEFWKEGTPNQVIYIASFLLLFTIGFMGGKFIGRIAMQQQSRSQNYQESFGNSVGNNQHNVLLIGVDNINSRVPELKSTWLIITIPNSSKLTLIPIYPPVPGSSLDGESALPDLFGITTNQAPQEDFLNQLRKLFWWDNYIIADEAGFRQIITRLDQTIREKTIPDTNPIDRSPITAQQKLDDSLNSQVHQMTSICLQANKNSPPSTIIEMFKSIDSHLISDINWQEIHLSGSPNRQLNENITCEFPTLSLNIP